MTEADLFPRAGAPDWQALATRSGRVALATLTARSDDGLPVGPIYPAGDGAPLPGRAPGARWVVVQRIDGGDDATVRETARTAVAGGATGLALVARDSATARGRGIAFDAGTLTRVSRGGLLDGLHLRIDLGEANAARAAEFFPTARQTGFTSLCLGFDPIATLAAEGALSSPVEATIGRLLKVGAAMDESGVQGEAFVADGRVWHDAGASEVQELAAVLATSAFSLRVAEKQGFDLRAAARRLGLILSVDADQFLSIAKLRAARQLLARLHELLAIDDVACRLHAETSYRMMSRRDPYLNMLRATGGTFAAAAGGAETLAVLPLALDGDPFADRMARNIQSIALDEAALFRVGDPGAGSGAIEALTAELAKAAWDEFRAIEAAGGMLDVVRSGALHGRIATMRDERLHRVSTRAIEIVGVNVHIDRGRPLPAADNAFPPRTTEGPHAVTAARLGFVRLAEPFEHLCGRAASLAADDVRPAVFVARLDASSPAGDAVAAATDALATAGLEAIGAGDPADTEGIVAAFLRSGAAVACIVAGETTPEETIGATAAALRAARAQLVLFHGAAKRNHAEVSAVDGNLSGRSDLVAVLGKTLDAIANAGKKVQNQVVDQKAGGSES